MKFKLENGATYEADVELSFVEAFLSNAMLCSEVEKFGFTMVQIAGSGSKRPARATWSGSTQEVEVPKQLKNIRKVS